MTKTMWALIAVLAVGLAFPAAGGPDYLDITVPERPVAGRNPQPSG